jgi:hypothetical protein
MNMVTMNFALIVVNTFIALFRSFGKGYRPCPDRQSLCFGRIKDFWAERRSLAWIVWQSIIPLSREGRKIKKFPTYSLSNNACQGSPGRDFS